MMLHVRATSAVVPPILDLCEANGWTALDTGSAGVLSRDNHPERGLAAWRAFRDKIVGTPDDGRPAPLVRRAGWSRYATPRRVIGYPGGETSPPRADLIPR